MTVDVRTLRAYAPLAVLLVTIAAGWTVFVRPVAADQTRAASQLQSLRQREIALRGDVGGSAPHGVDVDPVTRFERQTASGDASPALVERLAHLASEARARNLLIETVEGAKTVPSDPRFALFDIPVAYAPIKVAFDSDYASLGHFLWTLRNLPTTVEIRALSIGLPPPDPGDEEPRDTRTDILRVSLTLHAVTR
jgi:hypothetical protein